MPRRSPAVGAGRRGRCDESAGRRWRSRARSPAAAAASRSARPARFLGHGPRGRSGRRAARRVSARHPGVQVRVQQLPWTAAHEKLLTAFAGDALPDLCQLGNTWMPEFSALGALEPLDERMAAAGIPRDDYFAGILDTNVMPAPTARAAARRALVRRHAPAVLSQRPAARRRLSRGRPQTWAEWRAAMQDIRRARRRGSYGALLPLNESEPLFALALQQGAAAARRRPRGDFSQPPFRRALDFYARTVSRRPGAADGEHRRSPTCGTNSRAACSPSTSPARGTSASSGAACPPSGKATGRRRRCRARTGPGVSTAGGSSLVHLQRLAAQGRGLEADRVPERARDACSASTR